METIKLGNFFIDKEEETITVRDFHGDWKMTVGISTNIGVMLDLLSKEDDKTFCEVYIKLLYMMSTLIPDEQYMKDLLKIYNERIDRYPKNEESEKADMEWLEQWQKCKDMAEKEANEPVPEEEQPKKEN